MPNVIIVVTGASGAGKTATVEELERRALPGVRCFHFDSIGVPTSEAMDRDHGGAEAWQAWATREWLERLSALDEDVHVAVLDGQTRPSNVLAVDGGCARRSHAVLFDCSDDVRAERLRGARNQPELVSERMNNWAAYLRDQAALLNLVTIDTSRLTIAQAADELEGIVASLTASYKSEPNAS